MKTQLPPLPADLLNRLRALYAEPHRKYHTQAHIDALRSGFDRYCHLANEPEVIAAAIWFHDALYDTRCTDNESRSAELARRELSALGWPPEAVDRVAALVLATQLHDADPHDIDAWLFIDLDLSVLSLTPERYDTYCRAIRDEFDWVPDAEYRQGRSRVLARFLERPAIYRTPALHETWEAAALANVQREMHQLADTE